MSTYVGKWDCASCGTKRIPGWKDGRTVERCPVCNAPTTGKWYLDNRDMEIRDPEEVRKAKEKRAWKCGHCSHMNDADDLDCDACGNPKDESSDDKQVVKKEYKAFRQPTSAEEAEEVSMESVREQASPSIEGKTKSDRAADLAWAEKMKLFRKRRWIVVIAGLAILGFIAFLLAWKKEVPVTVVGFSWERKIDIETFGPVQESSWYSAPAGAYNVSSSQEIHHYNTIVVGRDCHTETTTEVCGTEDNGNGTFSDRYCTTTHDVCVDRTEEEPVYETRYYYTIDKWHFDHTEEARASDHNAYWPVFAKTQSQPATWRNGSKSESYWLHLLLETDKLQQQEVDFERWKRTKDRQKLVGYKNVVFGYWMGLKGEEQTNAPPKQSK